MYPHTPHRFVTGKFLTHYSPTIESTHRKAVQCNNLDILAEIVDTAGMDEYSRLSRNASVGVDGYVLVYSITSMASLEKVLGKFHSPPSDCSLTAPSLHSLPYLRPLPTTTTSNTTTTTTTHTHTHTHTHTNSHTHTHTPHARALADPFHQCYFAAHAWGSA
jgi:hypothetical protein